MEKKWLFILMALSVGNAIAEDVSSSEILKCTQETNNFRRLICYDHLFRTSDSSTPALTTEEASDRTPANVRLGKMDAQGFYNYTRQGSVVDDYFVGKTDTSGGYYLLISCQADITRLQLFSLNRQFPHSFEDIDVRSPQGLLFSGRWQRLNNSKILDIGRGLYAIANIKKLIRADTEATFSVNSQAIHFSLKGLGERTRMMSKACQWN